MSRTRPTIFIIDDDESVCRALGRLLRSVGLIAETFATAEEFLRLTGKAEPACLILDVHLPGLGGLELQELLTSEGRCLPIVFITAYQEDQVRQLALAAGAIAFLQKPFEEQSLLNAVDRALGGQPS